MVEPAPSTSLPGVAVIAADRRIRDSLASLLMATGRVEIVGLAADSPVALRLPDGRRPEVILVDPALLTASDGTLVAELRRHVPGASILLVNWDDRSQPRLPPEADGVLDAADLPGALLDVLDSAGEGSD